MAISFVAAGAVGGGGNPLVTVPTGYAAGDLLLIITSGTATPTTPTNWTQLVAQGAGQFITILYKFANTTEANFNLTQTGTPSKAVMVAYRGASGVEVLPAFTTGTGTTATPNTVTTTYSNDYVLSLYACAIGATTWTANGSTTSRVNSAATASVTGLLIADELQAAAGTSTARGATLSVSRAWSAFSIGIIENRTLYWVGGNGTWSTSATTNWSNSSGGASGVVAPYGGDNVVIDSSSGSPTVTLSGTPACKSLTTTGSTCTLSSTGTLSVYGAITLSNTTTWSGTGKLSLRGTGTITTNGVSLACPVEILSAGDTVTLGSNLTSTATVAQVGLTLTAGTLDLSTYSVNVTSVANSGSTTRSMTFGSGAAINVSGNAGTIWAQGTSTGFSSTGTPTVNLTYSGGTGTRTVDINGNITTARLDINVTAGTDTFAIPSGDELRNLNFTGFSGTFAPPSALGVFGSLTISSGMTWTTGTGTITFGSSSSETITTAGKTLYAITCNGTGSWTLQDTLNMTARLTVSSGTFSTNNNAINGGQITVQTGSTINLGSSTVTVNGSTSTWVAQSGVTLNAGTSTIIVTGTDPDFSGAGLTYYNVSFPGNTTTTITGSNTYNKISLNSAVVGGSGILLFTSGTTHTVGIFDVRGTSGNLMVLDSSSTTVATLASLSNAVQSNIDYISALGVAFSPTASSTGTTPYYWYIGSNSNASADFDSAVFSSDTSYKYYQITSGTSWSVPADWGSTNNVWLVGGGGGGSGSVTSGSTANKNSGSGGGGAGFTQLTNVSLTPGGTAAYTIGAGGTAGNGSTSSSTGGNGGTTTFLVSNTAGGGGGASTGLGTVTAGTAGTGATTNGGAGGLGNAAGANLARAGGGGGGAGGIDANGEDGGAYNVSPTANGGKGNGLGNNNYIVQGDGEGTFGYGWGGAGGASTGTVGQPGAGKSSLTINAFGGGGGGGGINASTTATRAGGAGKQGAIFIRYVPGSAAAATGNFLNFFYQ